MEMKTIEGSLPWSDGSGGSSRSGGGRYGGDPYIASYRALADTIVLQAVKDYKRVLRTLWDPKTSIGKKRKTMMEKLELEEFFHSDWYVILCDIDPDKLIYNCRQRALEQEKTAVMEIRKQHLKKIQEMNNETPQREK